MLVLAERGHERGGAGEARELHSGDRAPAGRLLEGLARVNDLAGARDVGHACELHPLDVAHDGDTGSARWHERQSHTRRP